MAGIYLCTIAFHLLVIYYWLGTLLGTVSQPQESLVGKTNKLINRVEICTWREVVQISSVWMRGYPGISSQRRGPLSRSWENNLEFHRWVMCDRAVQPACEASAKTQRHKIGRYDVCFISGTLLLSQQFLHEMWLKVEMEVELQRHLLRTLRSGDVKRCNSSFHSFSH